MAISRFNKLVQSIRRVVTVEPILAIYMAATVICIPALPKVTTDKTCRTILKFNDTVCDTIVLKRHHNYTSQMVAIQAAVDDAATWVDPLTMVVELISALVFGSFSDQLKVRKPFLMMPILGEMVSLVVLIMGAVYLEEWPLEVHLLFQSTIPAIFGGISVLQASAFAYIADITSTEERTMRMGIVQIVMGVAVLTQWSGWILWTTVGYVGVLSISGFMFFAAFLVAIFWFEETASEVVVNRDTIVDGFNPNHLLRVIKELMKKTRFENLVFVVVAFIILLVYAIVHYGETSFFRYYVEAVFSWDEVDLLHFLIFNAVIHIIGVAVSLPLMTKCFNLDDTTILGLAFLDKIVANILYGMAKTTVTFWFGPVCSFIVLLSQIVMRSMATKLVTPENFAKVQFLFVIRDVLESLIANWAIQLYQNIYERTKDVIPSAFFFFGSVLFAFCLPMFAWLYIYNKRNAKQTTPEDQAEETMEDERLEKTKSCEEVNFM